MLFGNKWHWGDYHVQHKVFVFDSGKWNLVTNSEGCLLENSLEFYDSVSHFDGILLYSNEIIKMFVE